MTKEQVIFVLGQPIIKDTFDHNNGITFITNAVVALLTVRRKELIMTFKDNRLTDVKTDFELSLDFNKPLPR